MTDGEISNKEKNMESCKEVSGLINKIEQAYKIYKISEVYLNDVSDDYGKQKLARLRLEFARHELAVLLEEARSKGIKLEDNEFANKYYFAT